MPRPGPRPYECVRRAWHSDRHQPMRGSLIQQIFKVVNEIHSAATKKNKEWQEKLPVVVLKAEEIMYSKANSEAEYADPKTLWERLNDAINTIIRRDESTESGDFLQPCIEAALNLGCTPRRASRSQRHNNPRCYLSPNTQEATETSLSPKISNHMAYEGPSCLRPPQSGNPTQNASQFAPHYSNLPASLVVNSARLDSDSGRTILRDKPIHHEQLNSLPMSCSELPPLSDKCTLPPQDKPSFPVDTRPSPSSGRMHPLYYISNQQTMEPRFMFQYPRDWNRDAFIVGTQAQPVVEPKTGLLLNLLGHNNARDSLNTTARASSDFGVTSENPHDMGHDLSLCLASSPALENSKTLEDLGSISPQNRSRFCDPSLSKMRTSHFDCLSSSPQRDKELRFFPTDTTNDPAESCSTKWSSEGEGLQLEATMKKRKAPIGNSVEDGQFCWQLKPSVNPFFSSTKGPRS